MSYKALFGYDKGKPFTIELVTDDWENCLLTKALSKNNKLTFREFNTLDEWFEATDKHLRTS